MKIRKITVELSENQYRAFAPAAKDLGTDAGSLILAIACDSLRATPDVHDPYAEMESILWRYVHQRDVPDVDKAWTEGGVEFFGNERSPGVLMRVLAS